jgi:hypothetical protein
MAVAVAAKKKCLMWAAISVVVVGYAGTVAGFQSAGQSPASAPPDNGSADHTGYFAQHFSANALNADAKAAVMRANLPPVSFHRIIVRTRDQITSSGQSQGQGQGSPSAYVSTITFENAGQGLVRRMELMQTNKGDTATRLELTYRGYFPFLTQSISSNASQLPPVVEARKVVRFDTQTDGHMNFTYFYGLTGKETTTDPGQVVCNAGNRYAASQINPAIEGQALELNCQMIDENGDVTNKVKFAYLDKYQVALLLQVKNPGSTLDSTIEDFKPQ